MFPLPAQQNWPVQKQQLLLLLLLLNVRMAMRLEVRRK